MSKQKQNYLYLTGNDGLYDTTFPTSPKGDKGARGYDGVDGQKGARGDKGSDGLAGRTTQIVGSFSTNTPDNLPKNGTFPVGWDDGVNPPVVFDVEIGESMYYTAEQQLWCYTPGSNVTNWTMLITASAIKGQTGDKGSTGDKGQKGERGFDGTNGANGEKGQKGEVGPKGEVGQKGDKGRRGIQGFKGQAGSNGTKGNPGTDGSDGTNGTNGGKGQKGEGGEKGRRGEVGPRGLKGQKGAEPSMTILPRLTASFNGESMDSFDSYNVLQILKEEVGSYRINFSQTFSNNRYTAVITANRNNYVVITERNNTFLTFKVKHATNQQLIDSDYITVTIYKHSA